MKIKKLLYSFLAAGLIFLPTMAPADDTEIYFQGGESAVAPPLVMFTIDYTPELGSTLCTGSGLTASNVGEQCPLADFVSDKLLTEDFTDDKITRFEMLRAVLKKILDPLGGMKIGLMVMHNDASVVKCGSAPCSNGAYIAYGFKPLDKGDTNGNKAAFYATLDALPDPQGNGNATHKNQNKELYFELFRYLTGQAVHNGHRGWLDFGTDGTTNLDSESYAKWDTSIELKKGASFNYVSPLLENCQKVFVINITGGKGNNANDSDAAISANLADGGMGFNVTANDSGLTEMVGWLHDKDLADGTIGNSPTDPGHHLDLEDMQNVTSFFVTVQMTQDIFNAAAAGGTSAIRFSDDSEDLYKTLNASLDQVLSVSTTFVSASIPVNVFNRSRMLNDMYLAVFQADENKQPQWLGNIKKLRLGVDTVYDDVTGDSWNVITIKDARGDEAFATDGRIKHQALTFWTDPKFFDVTPPADQTLFVLDDDEYAGSDGRSVNRGGAGQQILSNRYFPADPTYAYTTPTEDATTRTLYTEPDGYTNGTPVDLRLIAPADDDQLLEDIWPYLVDNTNGAWNGADMVPSGEWTIDSDDLNNYWLYNSDKDYIKLTEEANRVVNFMMGNTLSYQTHPSSGAVLRDASDNPEYTVTARRWLFGDPLHSRPLPINYGARGSYTTENPDVRLLVGSNDGYMRMIRNTVEGGDATAQSGKEIWAFMPLEAMRIQRQLMDNASGGSPLHPYGVDGPPSAYIFDHNQNGNIETADGDKVYLYFGLRRGGRAYYALDISTPDRPKVLWSISNTTTGFDELGYTFSEPVVRNIIYGSYTTPRPVVIFGGGYDIAKNDNGGTDPDTMGRAIFMVDGVDGSLVWKADPTKGLEDSIPSKVTAVDTTGNGLVDRLYVGDTGGRVWRADFPGADKSAWTVTKILDVGRHVTGAGAADDRRFFHAPDFVPSKDANGPYDGIVIGSGDRAKPLDTTVENYVYVFKDRAITSGAPPASAVSHSDLCTVDLSFATTCGASSQGWKLKLYHPASDGGATYLTSGDKVLSSPLTIWGVIYFTSYVPATSSSSTSCTPQEGDGYQWAISLYDASAVYDYDQDKDGNESFEKLDSTGIPADDQYISISSDDGSVTLTGVLRPDGKIQNPKGKSGWKSFWYQQED